MLRQLEQYSSYVSISSLPCSSRRVDGCLGFMILIHEFGHYAVAKLFNVRVECSAIGFGKRLFGFRKGDTDYRISAIPLGGYVKMAAKIRWMSARAIPANS